MNVRGRPGPYEPGCASQIEMCESEISYPCVCVCVLLTRSPDGLARGPPCRDGIFSGSAAGAGPGAGTGRGTGASTCSVWRRGSDCVACVLRGIRYAVCGGVRRRTVVA